MVGDPGLQAQFDAFDAANPQVFVQFKALALAMWNELHHVGKPPVFSAKFVWERLRWAVKVDVSGVYAKGFKLDNDLVSRYARKLADDDPKFEKAFRFRALKRRMDF